jgi:galactose mutarotase-like enzyme
MPGPGVGTEPGSGSADRIELATADLRLVVAPELGGRIVNLEDRVSGREWLVPDGAPEGTGTKEAWAAEDAEFSGERACGWDECLPTVAPCADPLEPTGPPLRDHGDGWGRPVAVDSLGVGSGISPALRLTWAVAGRYRFERLIRLNGPTVRTDYRLIAIAPDLPFLWAMHPLLALEPGAQLAIAGVAEVTVTNGAGLDLRTTGGRVGWPVGDLRTGGTVDLSRVPDTDAGIVRKLYADAAALEGPAIAWQPDGAGIAIDWDRQVAPALGIWIDAGGWPVGAGRQQIALEPTTAPFDDLATAIAHDRAAWAQPGHDVRWWATIRLVSREADLETPR